MYTWIKYNNILYHHISTFIRANHCTIHKNVGEMHRYAISGQENDCGGVEGGNRNNNLHSYAFLCTTGAVFIVCQPDGGFFFTFFWDRRR